MGLKYKGTTKHGALDLGPVVKLDLGIASNWNWVSGCNVTWVQGSNWTWVYAGNWTRDGAHWDPSGPHLGPGHCSGPNVGLAGVTGDQLADRA